MPKKLLAVTDFAKAGLNSDLMPWDLPGSFLTNIKNVRIIRGKLSPFGGSTNLVDLPNNTMLPGTLLYVNSTNGRYWMVMANDSVWVYDTTWEDISIIGGYTIANPEEWTGCMLANIPVINNRQSYPQYWNPQTSGTLLKELPFKPGIDPQVDPPITWEEEGESCRIMRSHKQFLFALDLVTSEYGLIPDGVRWSTPADINSVPESWDELDVTKTAGLTTLGGSGGRIIDGLGLRDAFVVYRENAITIFDYVQGSAYVWRIRELMSTVGAIAPDSIIEVKGRHYLIGDGDILVNDGNQVKSLLHNRIRKRFINDYNSEFFRNSYAVKNAVAYEIWFCIPDKTAVFPNLAYIYNWRDDTWAIRDIPESPSASYGAQASESVTWNTVPGTWEDSTITWSQSQITPLDDTVICVTQPSGGSPGQLRLLDKGITAPETQYDSTIERTDFALEGLSSTTTITSIFPHIDGPGTVNIRLGSQQWPGATVSWKAPVLFDPNTMRKVDVRTTGELHCFQFKTVGEFQNWSLSGIDIEYVDAGER